MSVQKLIGAKASRKTLDGIIEIVKTARKKYNNKDAEITSPQVNTADGCMDVRYLTDKDKAILAQRELKTILMAVQEADANVEGINPNREVTSLIAINPVLANISSEFKLELE